MLSGLLSQIGLREGETREYLGARGAHFMIFPGSPLAKKNPRWVMAAELVETSRLFARTVAKIQPEWIEPLAGHLVKRTYSEPHWSRKRAAAVAVERVTLHGVPIVVDRRVDYGRIDPETSRDLFIRHALVEGDWDTRHPFFRANRALLEDVEELETRARRRDLSVDEETLFAFYDARIPADVVSGRHFDTWWKKQRDKGLLDFTDEMVRTAAGRRDRPVGLPRPRRGGRAHAAAVVRVRAGPPRRRDHRRRAGRGVAPGGPDAVHVAGAGAARGAGHGADQDAAQDPATAVRARARPRPRRARPAARQADEPLLDGLERELGRMRGVTIPRDAWELDRLPEHLTVTFRVVDERGRGGRARHRPGGAAPRARPAGRARSWPPPTCTQHRAHHVDDRRAAARDRGAAGRARRHRVPRAWSTAASPSTCGCSRPPPSATPPTPAASGACCCSTPPRPRARCSAASTAPAASCSPATRTARSPRSSTTA